MDLEKLTKHQILLLTLLVSFVTSIATGIVTVSLMDQAPEGVTRVINQIVERTVETVAPASQNAAVGTVERTVVVQQDELIPKSIAAVQQSVIRIVQKGDGATVARGVVLGADGRSVTTRAAVTNTNLRDLEAVLPTGERVPFVLESGSDQSLAFITLELATTTGFVPAKLADETSLTLGQTVLRISGWSSDTVGEGVVAAVSAKSEERTTIEASVASPTPGSVLLTIFGEVIGISTSQTSPQTYTIIKLPETESVTN